MLRLARIAAATVMVIGAAAAHAVVVVPVSATGSSSYNGYNDFYAIDQGEGAATTDWASASQGTASKLNLDLGAVYNLSAAYVTDRVTSGGGNGGFVGGLFDFTTSFSLQAFTDASFTTPAGAALVFNKSNPAVHNAPIDFLDTVAVAGLSGRYIQYSVLAANGVNPGLSDIRFNATVPEPASWSLMIVGFGLVGLARRRRATVVAA